MTAARQRIARLGAGFLCLVLAACSLPRGAGFEAEVLAAGTGPGAERAASDGQPLDFAVLPVTRDALPLYAGWPATDAPRHGWLAATPDPPNRIIRPGDRIDVVIWTTEENSLLTTPGQRFVALDGLTVSAAGSVFLPYVGDLRLSGFSPERARATIEARYLEVAPSAQVQLEMTEGRLATVSLVGGVARPGSYPLPDQSFSVLSLLAEGGGVAPALTNPQLRLIRGEAIYGISIDRLYASPALDATLRGGDRVVVGPDTRFFLSLGAAGEEAVHDFPRDQLSALEALSIVGGVADNRADPQGILILRRYPAAAVGPGPASPPRDRVVFTLDLTTADGLFSAGEFAIRSGDLIYATESPVTAAEAVFSLIGDALGIAGRI